MMRALPGLVLLAWLPLAAQTTATNAPTADAPIHYITDDQATNAATAGAGAPSLPPSVPSAPASTGGLTPPPGTTFFAPSPQAAPATTMPGQPPQEDIDDIRPPFFFMRGWLWLWISLGVLALAGLIYLLWRWFRPQRQLSPKTAYELALEKLARARELLDPADPKPYAIAVSEAVRTYLGQRFNAPSTRRTTDEFLHQMQADPSTPLAAHRDLLRDFLQSCDLVKFARYQPGLDELSGVHERATNFVQATKPVPMNGATA